MSEEARHLRKKKRKKKKKKKKKKSKPKTPAEDEPELSAVERRVLLEAMGAGDVLAFKNASVELQGDRDVVLAAVALDGELLEFASDIRRADKVVVLAALRHDGDMLELASGKL